MSNPILYVALADGWYVSLRGEETVATPDKAEALKVDLARANVIFNNLRQMGHEAKIEFA